MTADVTTVDSAADSRRSFPIRAAIATVLSVVVNVGIVAAAGAFDVAPGFQALTVPPVAFLSAVGAIGAVLVYLLLRRVSSSPDRTFRRVAVAVLVLSFLPDIGLLFADETATPLGVGLLMAMHVTVAAICIGLLPGGGPRR
ncbi:DUF6069 family protein [Halopiger aswanensis]|uniref:Uncharacterized protein n=1 Tax=Halopiger aswanensis TaxID=148449 RepID=A0A3R7HX56_9EURY|nr:DUF6069 family protein [Halopiger aswanensis]RKD94633.1 hypothetical protein ATJ93_1468 [Halopiger aswanensis]